MVENSTYIFEQDGNTWSLVLSADKTKMIVTAFDKKTTKYTIQKVWTDGTEMPKTLEVKLYSFDKDSKDYNELFGYVNSKNYDKINEKVKTLKQDGPSVYLSADENWSHTWGGLDPDKSYFAWETDTNALAKYKIIDASVSEDGTGITITNTEEEGQYDLNIQKCSTSGEILNGVEFSLMSAKVNNEVVKNSKGETATNEKFVTSSVGIANVPSLTSVPNPLKITDVDNADVYVFKETNLPESIKNKYARLPDYVSIELTVNKGRAEVDGKTQLVAKSVSVKVIDNRTKKEYVGNRNNMVEYSFESNGKTYTAQIKASISDNTVTLTVENPDIPPEGEYKLSLVKAGDDERLGGVKFNLISARVNNGTISNGSSNVSEDNPIVITTNAQKPVGIWPTDGSSMKILSVTSDEYILKEADLGNNNKYVKLPDNKLIKLVILKEETNNEFKVSSINMYVGNDTDGWEPATYIFNEAHNMIIEARSTVTDSKGNEFTISFARSGDNLTLTVEDPKEETTKYTVSKKWDDVNSSNSRPDYVVFRLFGFPKNDAEAQKIYNDLNNCLQSKAYEMISSKIKKGIEDGTIGQYQYKGDINVRADDGWQEATWYNLSKDYNYFAWEFGNIDGYDITNAEVSNNNTKLTITNHKEPTKYTVEKVWDDNDDVSARPKQVTFRLFRFKKDNTAEKALYDELKNKVENGQYNEVSKRIQDEDIASKQIRNSFGVDADSNWKCELTDLSSDYIYFAWEVGDVPNYKIKNAEVSDNDTKITITNSKPTSKFNFTLVKYEQGSDKTLSGALFEITIKDENGNPLKTVNGTEINKYQQTTSAEYGRIGFDDIIIDGADKKYTVEITEVLAPAGYERIMDTISFQVTSKLADDGSYMLTPGDCTVANTKQCEVDESGNVIVNVEDKKTDKTEFAIYKEWENVKDTEVPDSITVELYRVPENKLDDWNKVKGDASARQEYLYRGTHGTGGIVTLTKDNAVNGNNRRWYYRWSDLNEDVTDSNGTKYKIINYVIETDGPEGFITTYSPDNYTSPESSVTITNTKDTTKYTVSKKWDDANSSNSRPDYVEFRLFGFDKNDTEAQKVYNDLENCLKNKEYKTISSKIKDRTIGQYQYKGDINVRADDGWQDATWYNLSKDYDYFAWEISDIDGYDITNAEVSDNDTKITITNSKPTSKFNFTLVKYEQGSDKTLSGALFEITIKDENGNPLKTVNGTEINKYQQTTSAEYGRIGFDDIIIDGADKKYTVEITEVLAPAGYERIMDTISFQVTSKLADDGSYMLTPGDCTVANTKQCEVDESGNVIFNVEDKKTDKTEFAIYKKWENVKDTELPDSITVELYQVPENKLDAWNIVKEDADARQEYLYRGAHGTGGQVTLTKADAVNGNNLMWYYKWTGLAKENNDTKYKNIYYVIETDGPEGFITTYEPNNYKSPDVNTVTITNTKETTHYTIQKVWDKNVQTSSMPRTLQVSLFAFNKNDENDTKLYNELIGYVNNKQYNEINNKIAELTDKKVGSSIGLSAGNQWSFTWSELSKDNNYFAWETDANALSKFNITNAVISDEETKMTITNTQPEGSFKLKLIKKLTNTNITLANAKFTLSIKDEAGNELIPNTSYEYKTDANGEIVVDKLAITGPNKEYTVTIKETKAPAGYVKLTDEVSFKVKSHAKADGSGFELIANDLTPIKNAKDAKVTEDGIEVTIYNDLTSPHKGVKDIKNQDSGYYDNVTGKVYTSKEEVASTLHDWVIQTTIPEGITAYTTYEISDEINEKLVFAGLDTVKVKYVNGADLTKDKDYKVTYDEASRMLKVTFVDESFKGGYNLEVGKDVEIRFNTTFALDNDGNIIAINEEVPNQAKLTYGNDSNNKQTKLTEIPEVHTGGVGIYKYDKKTNKALEGAHFKIATSKENALAGIFVKDGNGQDIEKVTNSNGLAEFAGLEFGEDALNKAEYEIYDSITGAKVYKYDTSTLSTTYYLVETESPKGYLKLEEPIEVVVKVGSYDMKDITSLVQVGNEEGIYDLSLRKFITAVKDTAKGTEEEVTSRIPQVDLTKLASGESTTATYTHPKDPVLVHTTDIVTYTIRIYNEGPQDAYASIVKDDIPDGLQFVQYTEGDGSLNAQYRWKLVDENDNEVTDVSKAKYIVTDYLSKEQDKTPGANLLKAYKPGTMSELDYRDVKVQFKVTEPTTSDRILINYAQISKETDSSGRIVRDRDSTPNVWVEGEDDQDIEKVRVQYFDLALRKWVTQAIVTENGKTVVTQTGHKAEDNPEEVVKVDLKKSKINNVVVKFRYSIRITNEGEIAGEATEIRDDIPQGLKFVAEDNPDWREENGQIVTNKLEHTTLQPGESAEVEILLTWVNSANNMGVMTNVAEINKDHNDYGAPDIDSTPGNNVPGEDDIDDAPVMLTVKTGSEYILYASIALSAIAVIAVGGKVIKKKVMRNI